jgi:hypothetical protein
VRRAPQPSTILWQNLVYGSAARRKIRCWTTLVALSLLFVSLGVAVLAKHYENKRDEIPGTVEVECPVDGSVPAVGSEFTVEEVTFCRCQVLPFSDRASDPECQEELTAEAFASLLTLLSVAVVIAMSTTVGNTLFYMTRIVEKHHSVENQEISVFHRMVCLLFLNLGIVTMLANSSWFGGNGLTLMFLTLTLLPLPLPFYPYPYPFTLTLLPSPSPLHLTRTLTLTVSFEFRLRHALV